MNKKRLSAVVFFIFLICVLWLIFAPCPVLDPDTPILSVPDYIGSVFPRPESEISFGCYTRNSFAMFVLGPLRGALQIGGVIVDIQPMFLTEWEISQTYRGESTPFDDRVFLYVDEKEVSKSWDWIAGGEVVLIRADGQEARPNLPGWYRFGSLPFLFPGDHRAKVVIDSLSGETIEYEWEFTITFP